jgi:hypothetical protein
MGGDFRDLLVLGPCTNEVRSICDCGLKHEISCEQGELVGRPGQEPGESGQLFVPKIRPAQRPTIPFADSTAFAVDLVALPTSRSLSMNAAYWAEDAFPLAGDHRSGAVAVNRFTWRGGGAARRAATGTPPPPAALGALPNGLKGAWSDS